MPNSAYYTAAEAMVRSLGMSCANKSTCHFICALELLHCDRTLLHNMGKFDALVAERYPKATPGSIEKSLRSARDAIMTHGDQARLREVMGYTLRRWPSVATLLDGIEFYMFQNGLWPD